MQSNTLYAIAAGAPNSINKNNMLNVFLLELKKRFFITRLFKKKVI